MRLKIILYSLLIFSSLSLSARIKSETVKFHKNIINTTKDDSIKLEHMIHLSWDYRNYNTDSALYYSNLAIDLAKSINQNNLLAKELDIRSTIMRYKNDLDSAEALQMEAISIRNELDNYRGLRSSY